MPRFSRISLARLKTCHPDLQRLFKEVVKRFDCSIIEGVRSKEKQMEYYLSGASKTVNSKHLMQKDGYSHAVDVMPYPIDWKDSKRNCYFVGYVIGFAEKMGIRVKSGIDWDRDYHVKDHDFIDSPHFELY